MSANATVTETEVLTANLKFYEAFSAGSFSQMNALWALRAQVTCLHPGATALIGRKAVMRSWQQLLGGPARLELCCHDASVSVFGDLAIVICYEAARGEPAYLAASNVFVREDGEWRMVHHHAGPLSSPHLRASVSALAN